MKISSINHVLGQACNALGSNSARLDAEVLLCSVLGTGREYVYMYPEQTLTQSQLADFNLLINSRRSGYPVAYLTGYREFWSIPLSVNRNTLIPRPETELLVEQALGLIPVDTNARILDLGTGSGAIAIAVARERPGCHITAADISTGSLTIARQNAADHGADNIEFVQSDWFSALGQSCFDLILCNPPYVESDDTGFIEGDIRHEPRLALDGGPTGMNAYIRIIPAAIRHMTPGACLLLEHGYNQGPRIRQILTDNNFRNVGTIKDLAGLERISIASYPG